MMPIKKCALKKSVINFQIYTRFNAKYQKYQSTILCVLEGVGCWGIFGDISLNTVKSDFGDFSGLFNDR